MKPRWTPLQARYLLFIHDYTRLHRVAPAHTDFQLYFRVTPPVVNSMLKTLEARGFIARTPRTARSIRLLVPRADLPDVE
jgi:hypothetical protein